nr:translation initiation factor IF-2-like isoform X2 [Manis javanica]
MGSTSHRHGGREGQRPAASRSPAAPAPTPTSPAGLRPASCGRNPNPRGRWRRRSHLPPPSARRPAVRMRAPGFPDGPPETAERRVGGAARTLGRAGQLPETEHRLSRSQIPQGTNVLASGMLRECLLNA